MISGKLKIIFSCMIFLMIFTTGFSSTVQDEKYTEIKEKQTLIDFEKGVIKKLMLDLEQVKEGTHAYQRLQNIIELKHKELQNKVEEVNKLINALSHSNDNIKKAGVEKVQTLKEIEYEVGIDREISSIHKKINTVYKDFQKTKERKTWQEKKDNYFKLEEQKKKIILVE